MSSRRRAALGPPDFFEPERPVLLVDTSNQKWPARLVEYNPENGTLLCRYEGVIGWPDESLPADSKRIVPCSEDEFQEAVHRITGVGDPRQSARDQMNVDSKTSDKPMSSTTVEIEFISRGKGKRAAYSAGASKPKHLSHPSSSTSCQVCSEQIQHLLFYCTNCSDNLYALCLNCFSTRFPFDHEHPIAAFAKESLIKTAQQLADASDMFPCHLDEITLDPDMSVLVCTDLDAVSLTRDGISGPWRKKQRGMKKKIRSKPEERRICAFCNDDKEDDGLEAGSCGKFVGTEQQGFVLRNAEGKGTKFYAHENCARFNPDVFKIGNQWFNVAHVLAKRAKKIKCRRCNYRGASIGCFAPECQWSFHVRCTGQKPHEFLSGKVFWCAKHDPALLGFQETFSCDCCGAAFAQDDEWYTCLSCRETNSFNSVDVCKACFTSRRTLGGAPDVEHVVSHKDERWGLSSHLKLEQDHAATVVERKTERNKLMGIRPKPLGPVRRPRKMKASCFYCWTGDVSSIVPESLTVPGELPTCSDCYAKAGIAPEQLLTAASSKTTTASDSAELGTIEAEIDAVRSLVHNTRSGNVLGSAGVGDKGVPSARSHQLKLYKPDDDQIYSLYYEHTYYDIEDRAPRWATHSGAYHGQWLPQVPRYSILRFTRPDDLVLSNFLGQGTDAIECFLLQRHLVGVDINPSAILLSRRNLYFSLPVNGHSITPAHRPKLVVGDARYLDHRLLADNSFDHLLCHPPYKNAIKYTDDVEGDLSHIVDTEEFKQALVPMAQEAFRVLKPGKRATICMGDNRRLKIYQPLTFDLVKIFVDAGFEVEELIVKRQRFMEYSPLGQKLASTFNFQFFNHELVAIVRKRVDSDPVDFATWNLEDAKPVVQWETVVKPLPFLLRDRKAGARGTLWVIPQKIGDTGFDALAMSRVMERFGHNNQFCEFHDLSKLEAQLRALSYKDSRACGFPPAVQRLTSTEDVVKDEFEGLGAYERGRAEKMVLNRLKMKEFGLLPTPDPEPGSHLDMWLKAAPASLDDQAQLEMMVMPALAFDPETIVPDGDWVYAYRSFVRHMAKRALTRLKEGGTFLLCAKDVRVDVNRKVSPGAPDGDVDMRDAASDPKVRLVPFTMLLLDDVRRSATGSGLRELRLREVTVCVPDKHAKHKTADIEGLQKIQADLERSWAEETAAEDESGGGDVCRRTLPIVHTFFFIFQLSVGEEKVEEADEG